MFKEVTHFTLGFCLFVFMAKGGLLPSGLHVGVAYQGSEGSLNLVGRGWQSRFQGAGIAGWSFRLGFAFAKVDSSVLDTQFPTYIMGTMEIQRSQTRKTPLQVESVPLLASLRYGMVPVDDGLQ